MEHQRQTRILLPSPSINLHITSKQRESREKGWLTKKENVWQKRSCFLSLTQRKSRVYSVEQIGCFAENERRKWWDQAAISDDLITVP